MVVWVRGWVCVGASARGRSVESMTDKAPSHASLRAFISLFVAVAGRGSVHGWVVWREVRPDQYPCAPAVPKHTELWQSSHWPSSRIDWEPLIPRALLRLKRPHPIGT